MELPSVALSEDNNKKKSNNNNNNNNNVKATKHIQDNVSTLSISSENTASTGFLFGILFCVVIVIAGKIHWGDDAPICLVPADVPFQDYTNGKVNETDYPNPRCASLYKDGGRFPEDKGSTHYFWQLPPETRDLAASQSTAWIFYSFHQIAVWATIYFAQLEYGNINTNDIKNNINIGVGEEEKEEGKKKYSKNIRNINKIALSINLICWLLHLIHTHVWYDALAPSVHEMSSQGSVILMLIIVLVIEAPNRGLFFAERRTFTPKKEVLEIIKKYHGYVFSWAVIYTFWYHPMEGYFGHLFGFFHVWIVMLQGSLMYTTVHLNKYWRIVCESWVFIHGTVISMQTLNSNTWPMFTFGFGAIFVLTQLPGLPCLKRKHIGIRLIPLIIFIIIYVIVYVTVEKFTKPYVVLFIPMAEYFGAIGMNIFMYISILVLRKVKCRGEQDDNTRFVDRRIGMLLFFMCILITTICSIIAQKMELNGETGGTLMVYIPMCIVIPLSLFAIRCAMPYKNNEIAETITSV